MTNGFDGRRASIGVAAQVALQLLPTESRFPEGVEVINSVAARIVGHGPGEAVDTDEWADLYDELGTVTGPIIETYDVGDLLEVYVADLLSIAIHHLQGDMRSDHMWEEVVNTGDGIAFMLNDPDATDPLEQALQDLRGEAEGLADDSPAELDRLSRSAAEFGGEYRHVVDRVNRLFVSRLPKPRS